MGPVWLTVHSLPSAPRPLGASMRGWEVAEEADLTIRHPMESGELG